MLRPAPERGVQAVTDDTSIAQREKELRDFLCVKADANVPAVFILGSPRTGSTFLYQCVAAAIRLPYVSNLLNYQYADQPVVGFALQQSLIEHNRPSFENSYGKVKGLLEPSEGSALIASWFGGGHPSEIKSADFKPGRDAEMIDVLSAVHSLYGRPLVTKNPWNCFRVKALATALPNARFIWIRRNIARAAGSDLAARYVTKGTPHEWNSATPANYEQLLELSPPAQVVENQYEFARALNDSLNTYANGRFQEVWYEDLCAAPESVLRDIAAFIDVEPQGRMAVKVKSGNVKLADLPAADETAIDHYIEQHRVRLDAMGFKHYQA